jgi:GcrA cell cycle regulator
MTQAAWTSPRVERLKALWAEGLSASEIAERLSGVTRNAVLGKLYRLHLLGGRKALPGTSGPKPGRQRTVRQVRDRTPDRPPRPVRPAAAPAAWAELPGEVARLDALRPHQCHWPIGDPKAEDFAFCGRWMHSGPYCDAHRQVAYVGRAAARRRRRRR